jgi:hypothetical protein
MNGVNGSKNFMADPHTFATQLNDWLTEAENSTSADLYRSCSMEDYRFYSGDQDSTEVRAALEALKRPVTTYNEVKPKIDMLVGLGAQMKQIPFPVPKERNDAALTEIMGGLFRHYRNKLNSGRVELSCFEHMIKGGLGYQHYWIDNSNPFKPALKTARVPGRDCWVDPVSVEYDMADARFFFRDKWLDEEEINIRYPDLPLDQIKALGTTQSDIPAYYDLTTEKYRLIEGWFRKLEKVYWFINPLTQKEEWLLPDAFKQLEASLREGIDLGEGRMFQLDETQSLDKVEAWKRNIYFALFCSDTIVESGPTPYNHEQFPYIQYGAYKDEDNNRWFGAVSMMKDPQVNLNTMRRQLTHLLQTAPRGILMHEVGAIMNVEDYETRGADPTYHMEIAQGKLDKVKFSNQPQISPIYQYLDGMNSQGMKDTSGVQDSLMGVQTSSREPGVSVQMRQEQNIAVLHILFSNYKESRRLSALQMLSLIQQYVSEAEMFRIEGQKGMQMQEINTQMNPELEGFNDISALEYDIAVDEDIESTTTRLGIMRMLTDFSVANPGTIPPDIIMEYANMPLSVQQRVMAYYEQRRQEELAMGQDKIDNKQ